jgi:hypothetical protein
VTTTTEARVAAREPLVRGYLILDSAAYFRSRSEETPQRFDEELPLPLRMALDAINPTGFYPRRHHAELLAAIARGRHGDDALYVDLMQCGAQLAVPDNYFAKLLLKVLTPQLFVQKLPKLWSRDHRDGGRLELESIDPVAGSAKLRLVGVGGYTHGAIVWLGWIKRVLVELACPKADVRQAGWTWTNPEPSDVSYEVRWS